MFFRPFFFLSWEVIQIIAFAAFLQESGVNTHPGLLFCPPHNCACHTTENYEQILLNTADWTFKHKVWNITVTSQKPTFHYDITNTVCSIPTTITFHHVMDITCCDCDITHHSEVFSFNHRGSTALLICMNPVILTTQTNHVLWGSTEWMTESERKRSHGGWLSALSERQ